MTEPNERITALETNMKYVLETLAKREDYQNSVLVKLTTIELKQDQALLYQKTCDAERAAHAQRLGKVENDNAVTTTKTSTVWITLLLLGSGVVSLVSLALNVYKAVRPA